MKKFIADIESCSQCPFLYKKEPFPLHLIYLYEEWKEKQTKEASL